MKTKIILSLLTIFFAYSCEEPKTEANAEEVVISENTEIPVEAYVVKKEKIEEKLPFTAILQPSQSVDIIPEASGKIVQINKQVGNYVKAEDILAIIDDEVAQSNLEQAKAHVQSTATNLKIAELNLKSDRQLFENGDISSIAYDNSELAVKTAEANNLAALAAKSLMLKQFRDTRILSPIQGVVARKYVELGAMVNPTMPAYRVVDLDVLKLEIGVPQSYISIVEVGDEAEVTISALKNKIFSGYVKYISPQADETTGAFATEIHLNNTSDHVIKAGMTAKVNLVLKTKNDQLILPNHALVARNGDHFVYKINKSMASLIPVSAGETYGSQLVIDEGLTESDTVVVVGMKNLGLETKVWIETLHNQ